MRISDWSSDVCSSDLHYHAAYVAPRWRSTLERVAQIGAHIFYRNQESARLTGKYSGEEPVLPAILTLERRVGAQGSIQEKREARTMPTPRSEERSVGKVCVSTGRSQWKHSHYT